MNVHIVSSEVPGERERILPRLARLLASATGWTAGPQWSDSADLNYALPYLEARRWPANRQYAAYFTHREDDVRAKVQWWGEQAENAALRITSAQQYVPELAAHGPTCVIAPPLDRDFFSPRERPANTLARVGVSGFSYAAKGTQRKGEHLLREALKTNVAKLFDWTAIGRGWAPLKTKQIEHSDLPAWYASLDLYVCSSLIEGVPYGPLEALACGVPVVIPRGVGLLDELPNMLGIFRYERGNIASMCEALTCAEAEVQHGHPCIDRDALRAATERFTEESWINGHMEAFATLEVPAPGLARELAAAGITAAAPLDVPAVRGAVPSAAGIFIVAYGTPARRCAEKLIASIRLHMPGIPVAVASERPLEGADVQISHPDADLGGRTAKTKMYELAPAEWERVLYLDADIELTASISFLFDALVAGWEMVCTKDVDGYDLVHSLFRRDSREHELGWAALGSDRALQLAGGVVAFRRTENTERFFAAWYEEWHRLARRDQGALIRAMYAHPVRLLVLGNEWNSFAGIFKGQSAGILHHRGGPARRVHRWDQGRLDDPTAWNGDGALRAGIKPSHAERAAALRARTAAGATRIGVNRYRLEDGMERQCPACTSNNGACPDHPLPQGIVVSGERPAQRPVYVRQRASTGVAGIKGVDDSELINPSDLKLGRRASDKQRKTLAGNKAR